MLALGIFQVIGRPLQWFGSDISWEDKLNLKYIRDQLAARKGLRPNFLGLSINGADGRFHYQYDSASGAMKLINQDLKSIAFRKQVNLEAKSFLEKIEREAEEAVRNGKSAGAHH